MTVSDTSFDRLSFYLLVLLVLGALRVSDGESAAVEPWHCLETINKCLRESGYKEQIDCLRRFTCPDDVDESMRQKYINETIKEKSEIEWRRNIDAGDVAHAYMKADGATSNAPGLAPSIVISGWGLRQMLIHSLLFI
ncbi:unnamed protein product [Lymnaea stagnalis]|uniref:Uncharacterized protein n=1 Tax=Lymnaea stagnalis TaxID=6523 RepID=A0AAV2HPX7_LYMST